MNRKAYSKEFFKRREKYGNLKMNLADAMTHREIIEESDNSDYRSTSFRAVVEHIRAEKQNPKFERAYIGVFWEKLFCQRILADLPI